MGCREYVYVCTYVRLCECGVGWISFSWWTWVLVADKVEPEEDGGWFCTFGSKGGTSAGERGRGTWSETVAGLRYFAWLPEEYGGHGWGGEEGTGEGRAYGSSRVADGAGAGQSGLVRVPIPVCQDAETQETERKQWGKTRGTNARPRPGWAIDEMEESSLRREQSSRTESHGSVRRVGWVGWSGHSLVCGGWPTNDGGGCLVRTCRVGAQSARL